MIWFTWSYLSFLGYLRGVDIIGETSLLVTGEASTLHWAGYGLKVHIPQGSLPAGMEECRVDVKAGLTGQFEFSKGSELVSAVYYFCSPVKFSHPLTVEIQHCAKSTIVSSLSFVVAKCSQEDLPYKFNALRSGVFTPHSCYGSIALSHFSIIGITSENGADIQYCSKLYYLGNIVDWKVHFVITKDLETFITVNIIISLFSYCDTTLQRSMVYFNQQELFQSLQRSHELCTVARCIIAVNVFRVAKYIGPSSGFYICG